MQWAAPISKSHLHLIQVPSHFNCEIVYRISVIIAHRLLENNLAQ